MPTEEGRGHTHSQLLEIQLEKSEMKINAESILLFLFLVAVFDSKKKLKWKNVWR